MVANIDYREIDPGIYRNSRSGLATRWDIRVKEPNSGNYLSPEVLHSIEHTMSTYLVGKYGRYRIINVSPMGCQTGFRVITRFIDRSMILEAVTDYIMHLQRVLSIDDAKSIRCSNYRLHDLKGAKFEMLDYYDKYLKFEYAARKY